MHQHDDHQDDHDKGLVFDLEHIRRQFSRRNMLKLAIQSGMAAGLVSCGTGGAGTNLSNSTSASSSSTGGTGGTTGATSSNGACSVIPSETGGPYPGDGSNGPNVLTTTGVLRSDIRSSFASLSGTADGIPLQIVITLVNVNDNCSALPGLALYLWHCDRLGRYSIYDITNQNYLRGLQETNSAGQVTFTTIFPGCYSGRWPHIHFEVFPSLALATNGANQLRTSQIALTSNACNQVYATTGYGTSQSNFSSTSLATDNVFSDGFTLQIPEITGDVTNGFSLRLDVGLAV